MEKDIDTISYGTPLQPLLEDELPDKKPIQDLTVRDENGRRRFHGAFTGGFSAGYYNTVGTKEGWTPSYFKSSRYLKADKRNQRPEDFMDTEDLNQFGIAPRTVQATKDFRTTSDEKNKKNSEWNSNILVIPGQTPLEDLIKPVNDHIGIQLLRALGWKPGQGIGPRIKKKQKVKKDETPKQPGVKVYGCALPTELSDEEFDDYALAFTFAPEDISTIPYLSKDNTHGIGYSGIGETDFLGSKFSSEDPNTTRAVLKTGRKIAIRGQAFGVGAFEDDDEDIYAKDDMTQYDFVLTEQQRSAKKNMKQIKNSDKEAAKKEIRGFHLASKPVAPKKKFPPPELPSSFLPNKRMIVASIQERFSKPPSEHRKSNYNSPAPKFLNRHILSAEERAQMLGDKFQDKPPSHLSETVIPKLAAVPAATPSSSKTELEAAWKLRLSSLDKDKKLEWATQSTTSKLKPFASDLAKQKRYELYLEMQKAERTDFSDFQIKSMTEWEKEKEREEFYRAAVLFRPLRGTLSQKFVSKGTNVENDHDEIKAAREKNAKEASEKLKSEIKVRRIVQEWHPDKLICRRFNVPNPFPDSATVGLIGTKKQKVSIFEFLPTTENTISSNTDKPTASKSSPAPPLTQTTPSTSVSSQAKSLPKSTSTLSHSAPSTSVPVLTNHSVHIERAVSQPPNLDLFKAIFADSEDSESEPEDDIEEEEIKIPDKIEKPILPEIKIPKIATHGVFSSLGEVLKNSSKATEVTGIQERTRWDLERVTQMPDLYGPALPPELLQDDVVHVNNGESRDRKHDKSKKQKHKKKKSKRKHGSDDELNHKLKKKLKELGKYK